MGTSNKYFSTQLTKKQVSDTGMAVVLIFLLIGLFTDNEMYYKIAIPVLIMNMVFPLFYYFIAILWLGLSNLLGTIVSKVILSVVYILLIIPIGMFRRILGKDSLLLLEFKKSESSVMKTRNYTFSQKDIEKPY